MQPSQSPDGDSSPKGGAKSAHLLRGCRGGALTPPVFILEHTFYLVIAPQAYFSLFERKVCKRSKRRGTFVELEVSDICKLRSIIITAQDSGRYRKPSPFRIPLRRRNAVLSFLPFAFYGDVTAIRLQVSVRLPTTKQ